MLCVLKLLYVTPLVRRTGSQTTSSRRAVSVLRRSVLCSDFITVERVARASVHLVLHSRGPSRLEAGITCDCPKLQCSVVSPPHTIDPPSSDGWLTALPDFLIQMSRHSRCLYMKRSINGLGLYSVSQLYIQPTSISQIIAEQHFISLLKHMSINRYCCNTTPAQDKTWPTLASRLKTMRPSLRYNNI